MNVKIHNNRGFTLIELLVVIAIIGLLSTSLLVLVNNARIKAREARRKQDISEVQKALELYFLENQNYPHNGTVGNPNNETDISHLASFLVPAFLSSMPQDPKNFPDNYMYVWKQDGREFGLFVPFANDGGTSCKFRSPGGSQAWFSGAPDCVF